MWKIWNNLLSLFFPELCLLCKEPLIEGEEQICLNCLCDLPHTLFHNQPGNPVEQLFMGKFEVVRASAFLFYQKGSQVQTLLHTLKYDDNKELAYLLGRMAAQELMLAKSKLCSADLLIPVPLHPNKEKQRGYNQSEWIAIGMSSVLNIPVDTQSLRRIKDTVTQTNRGTYHRWVNVKNIFSVEEENTLSGKHLLLIDDVITTGATIGACAEILSELPEVQISIFGLAVTTN